MCINRITRWIERIHPFSTHTAGCNRNFLNNPSRLSNRILQYRGTSLTRKCTPLGPYRRPRPRVLGGS